MTPQDKLVDLIKRKGIGKTMSKALDKADCDLTINLLSNPSILAESKTTLLVAFIMLKNTPTEQICLQQIQTNYKTLLPKECHFLFNTSEKSTQSALISCIHHILNQQDLSTNQLKIVTETLFDSTLSNCYKAAFLEGLRLKEESPLENSFFQDYLYQKAKRININTPILIDLSTAYDGFNRFPNLILALAALLASIGFPTILHGCKDVSPKFGITLHKCLDQLQLNPLKTMKDIQICLESPTIGWGYCDQSISFPELHQLEPCRKAMVKRPILATVEKFMQPFHAKQTCIVTGYTHPAYRHKTTSLLKLLPHCHQFTFFRGVEGSCLAPLDRRCPVVTQSAPSSTPQEGFISPEDFNLEKNNYIQADRSLTVTQTCVHITNALKHSTSPEGQWIIYNALALLTQFGFKTPHTKSQLNESITSGKAWKHLMAY